MLAVKHQPHKSYPTLYPYILGSRSFLGFWSTPGNGLDGLVRQFFDSRVLSRPSKRVNPATGLEPAYLAMPVYKTGALPIRRTLEYIINHPADIRSSIISATFVFGPKTQIQTGYLEMMWILLVLWSECGIPFL
jgi:hypothetical protein